MSHIVEIWIEDQPISRSHYAQWVCKPNNLQTKDCPYQKCRQNIKLDVAQLYAIPDFWPSESPEYQAISYIQSRAQRTNPAAEKPAQKQAEDNYDRNKSQRDSQTTRC